jgi:hypothetical protein
MRKDAYKSRHFKDYRSINPSSSKKKKKTGAKTLAWLWMLLFLLACIGGTYGFITYHLKHSEKTLPKIPSIKEKALTHLAPLIENSPAPRFEFYTLLSERSDKNIDSTPSISPLPPEQNSISPTKKMNPQLPFYVQVDIFSQYPPADSLKAELLLLGFDNPTIQSFEPRPKERAYRLVFGPFTQIEEARKLTTILKKQHFSNTQVIQL